MLSCVPPQLGGIVLHEGQIAEMQTGEGKTLVATLPAYLNALSGRGVHMVTVNDYLARRDAQWCAQSDIQRRRPNQLRLNVVARRSGWQASLMELLDRQFGRCWNTLTQIYEQDGVPR